jgi:cobalt-zinc-cadmium efflux system outer membrane protein
MNQKDTLMYFSLRQPIELGHQTRYRYAIARAALTQQQWAVLQSELQTLVQTYRFFQTAAYRREKLRVAQSLSDFNDRLLLTLRHRFEANQVQADAVVLAEVETEAAHQLVDAARQDYANALTDLRNQIGIPESAGTAEPLGEFILPTFIPDVEDETLIETALRSRPEIQAAAAQVDGSRAAIGLAKGDRIPTPVVGPTYERDEQGTQFVGLVYITPIPILNNGAPLVRQREAEYRRACIALQQVQQRTVAQVKAAIAKWNGANQLVARTASLTDKLQTQVANLQKLFDAGQTDLSKILQAQQRLIQLDNARLDAIWQATQAQSDLLLALGAPTLIEALQRNAVQSDSTDTPPGAPPSRPETNPASSRTAPR